MLTPLAFERALHGVLGFRIDQVDDHRLTLQEAVNPVDRLDQVVELEADADEDCAVAVR